MKIPSLHDASLLDVQFHWELGTLELAVRYRSDGVVRAQGVVGFHCSRTFPWGRSRFILHTSSEALPDGNEALTIAMQSGDDIVITARAFEYSEKRSN